jgi:hypothetical protein
MSYTRVYGVHSPPLFHHLIVWVSVDHLLIIEC